MGAGPALAVSLALTDFLKSAHRISLRQVGQSGCAAVIPSGTAPRLGALWLRAGQRLLPSPRSSSAAVPDPFGHRGRGIVFRSEERRVGKEWVSPFRSRWSAVH